MFNAKHKRMMIVIGVVVSAVVVRAIYMMLLARNMGISQFSDFLYMHQLADSLANGRGFTIDGVRIFNQSAGYPAFLSVFYSIFIGTLSYLFFYLSHLYAHPH